MLLGAESVVEPFIASLPWAWAALAVEVRPNPADGALDVGGVAEDTSVCTSASLRAGSFLAAVTGDSLLERGEVTSRGIPLSWPGAGTRLGEPPKLVEERGE